MKIKWLGHASFLITTESDIKILTDPYLTCQNLSYGEIKEVADIVTVSHGHRDHNYTEKLPGKPRIINQSVQTTISGVPIKTVAVYHDDSGGKQRGNNLIFCFDAEKMRLCHAGDLGHVLDAVQIEAMNRVDILFLPVGGYYTIDAAAARKVIEPLRPRVVFPMHYKTDKCSYPIGGLDEFLSGMNVRRIDGPEVEIIQDSLPGKTTVFVLKSAL